MRVINLSDQLKLIPSEVIKITFRICQIVFSLTHSLVNVSFNSSLFFTITVKVEHSLKSTVTTTTKQRPLALKGQHEENVMEKRIDFACFDKQLLLT
jgi:hypothetical protein